MKLIKLNNIQANKITGIYNGIWAIDPIYVEDDFWIVKLNLIAKYDIAKRYLLRLKKQGKITIIDMSKPSPERIKIMAAFNAGLDPKPTTKIVYKGKHIIREL